MSELYLERVTGLLLPLAEAGAAVVAGPEAPALGAAGELALAFGLHIFEDPRLFFPQFVVDDFAARHRDQAVFAWLEQNSFLQPRADVFGLWPDGRRDQIFARDVDAARPPVVLAGPGDAAAPLAGARVALAAYLLEARDSQTAVAPAAPRELPTLLARALPAYTLNLAWVPPDEVASLLARLAAGGRRDLELIGDAWRL
jgi:hypothetical protein